MRKAYYFPFLDEVDTEKAKWLSHHSAIK
jgi:hypothetical protein